MKTLISSINPSTITRLTYLMLVFLSSRDETHRENVVSDFQFGIECHQHELIKIQSWAKDCKMPNNIQLITPLSDSVRHGNDLIHYTLDYRSVIKKGMRAYWVPILNSNFVINLGNKPCNFTSLSRQHDNYCSALINLETDAGLYEVVYQAWSKRILVVSVISDITLQFPGAVFNLNRHNAWDGVYDPLILDEGQYVVSKYYTKPYIDNILSKREPIKKINKLFF